MTTDVREEVRERYAEAALGLESGCGCGCDCESIGCCGDEETTKFGKGLYAPDERSAVPESAVTASLGCGNPVAVAELKEGETVLDLGSGGGIDVLLSARRVGPGGTVYGLDMTDEMLALALRNAEKARASNVHFLKGMIEAIPLPGESVDVVISNCVVNLSPEKDQVLAEIARVLRPGGRVGITDVVAEDRLSPCRPGPAREPRRLHRRRALGERVPRRARDCRPCRRRGRAHARGRRRHARRDRARAQAAARGLSLVP